jgi:hypothetical protein
MRADRALQTNDRENLPDDHTSATLNVETKVNHLIKRTANVLLITDLKPLDLNYGHVR